MGIVPGPKAASVIPKQPLNTSNCGKLVARACKDATIPHPTTHHAMYACGGKNLYSKIIHSKAMYVI